MPGPHCKPAYDRRKDGTVTYWTVKCLTDGWSNEVARLYPETKKAAENLFNQHKHDLDGALPPDMRKALDNLHRGGLY